MKRLRLLALLMALLLIVTAFAGCSAEVGDEGYENMNPTVAGDGIYENGGANEGSSGVEESRKLIRTVNIDAETADMDALLSDLDAKIAELGGYVQSKSVRNGSSTATYSTRYATLTLRIPAEHLDSFVGHVEGATNILSSNETAEDVTLKYVAVQSRITALETEEARLLELLAKAESLNDLLTLESKLADVRTELEEVKSQLKVYDNQVSYGTLHLTVTEVKEYTVVEQEPTAWERISTGFVKSLKGVWNILTELFIFLIIALPYLVIPAAIAVIVLVVHKKKKAKTPKSTVPFQTNPPEQPQP